MDLYQEVILDHAQNPRNYGKLQGAAVAQEKNPSCGDILTLYVRIEQGVLKDVRFEGAGCALSQAAASLLTEEAKGKTVEEVRQWGKEKIFALLGVEVGVGRIKCALLALRTLGKILQKEVQ